MNKFENISKEEQIDWIDIKIKIPKNTLCFIVNYIEQNGSKVIMGNIQYDSNDILNNKK